MSERPSHAASTSQDAPPSAAPQTVTRSSSSLGELGTEDAVLVLEELQRAVADLAALARQAVAAGEPVDDVAVDHPLAQASARTARSR